MFLGVNNWSYLLIDGILIVGVCRGGIVLGLGL